MITLLLGLAVVAVARSQSPPDTQSGLATTIRDETMLDGRGGVLRNVVIRVENGRIASVAQSRERATYDLPGITVMPGWIDTSERSKGAPGKQGNGTGLQRRGHPTV